MSERPEAIRKYIAPSPRPVIVSSTKVLISRDPQQATHERLVAEKLRRFALVADAPGVDHDDVSRNLADDAKVLLDEHDRRELGGALEHPRDLGDEQRREALRRLVDQEQRVAVQKRARDRNHLLLAARERAGPLLAALLQLGEELVDEAVARLGGALGEGEVLGH